MQMRLPFTKMGIPPKDALGNIIIIANLVVWYTGATAILREAVGRASFTYHEKLILDIILFSVAVTSVLGGASFVNRLSDRKRFLFICNLFGVFSSLALMISEKATMFNVLFLLSLVGVSFGLGFPACMAVFAEATKEENRARFGSMVILSIFLGILAFKFITPANFFLTTLILAVWRLLGLIGILLLGNLLKNKGRKKSPPTVLLLKDRSLLLYLIPWTVFSTVNYLGWPISSKIHGEDFVYSSIIVSNVLSGIFALVAGFVADKAGRKRILVGGFIIFGIGYAVLGINPFNIYVWYSYMFIDGIAWGIFFVIFWFTIWGDLARGKASEKYYAIGIIPYSLSGFLRVTLGSIITDIVSEYAIFSFSAFFLFLAVVPLMFAPETLPEKKIRERELRKYIEKAKKVKEKYV